MRIDWWCALAALPAALAMLGCKLGGSSAGCAKDSDCKGDRVCVSGACQESASAAGTAATKSTGAATTAATPAHAGTGQVAGGTSDGKTCGLPLSPCANPNGAWHPWDLTWNVPPGSGQHMSRPFYAVILMSVPSAGKNGEACGYVSESERLNLQNTVFTQHKVFTSRFGCPGAASYTAAHTTYNFVAVYAGETQADAQKVLEEANDSGKFDGANIRQMQAIWTQP